MPEPDDPPASRNPPSPSIQSRPVKQQPTLRALLAISPLIMLKNLYLKWDVMSYRQTLDYLYHLQWHGIHPGLERMERLLSLAGRPETKFRSVHIAGTNGKGSTAAMVASCLKQGGYRVGLYSSPHLIDFSERIRVSEAPIPIDEVIRLTAFLRRKMETEGSGLSDEITFFEFTTALAFLYFSESNIDFAVVEVGLGGRWDATNLLHPLACAITQIDFDHERYLGATLPQIASEKAGIIKERTPVVTGATHPDVLNRLEETAHLRQAPLKRLGHEIKVSSPLSQEGDGGSSWDRPQRFFYDGVKKREIEISLLGGHQIANAAVAIGLLETLQGLGIFIAEQDIHQGLKQTRWSGRLEVVRKNPLILLDGAHNPSGARALGTFLGGVDPNRQGKHWLITGIMRDKNIEEILAPLLAWTDELVLTQPDVERAADPSWIAGRIEPLRKNPVVRKRVSDAILYVEALIQPQDTLVITGSLYTIGEAMAFFSGVTPSVIRG